MPDLGQWLWPKVLVYIKENGIEEWKCSIVLSYCWNTSIFILSNLVYMAIYKAEHPFFE